MPGPTIRTDIVDVYVFRLPGNDPRRIEFLQMRRCGGVMGGTWQPVMGHVNEGETAVATALRELDEETRFNPRVGSLQRFWQLEWLNTYLLAKLDCVMMSPCFAALVKPGIDPTLDDSHDALRWVPRDHVDRSFMWPGQRVAIDQLMRDILPAVLGHDTDASRFLEIPL